MFVHIYAKHSYLYVKSSAFVVMQRNVQPDFAAVVHVVRVGLKMLKMQMMKTTT